MRVMRVGVTMMTAWLLISCCVANRDLAHKPCLLSPQGCQALRAGDFTNLDSSSVIDAPEFEKRVVEQGGTVEFVFGDDRPFRQCHASTLTQVANGDLLAAWFGGTREKNPDVAIWMSRRAASGWTPPQKVARAREMAHWNPVLFTDPASGAIHLFFKVGLDPKIWSTWRRISRDHGLTWTDPEELVPGDVGGRGPVKNKPIVLSDGTWLAPASTEKGGWQCFADRSTDGGRTWTRTDNFPRDPSIPRRVGGAIQPTFWESEPGHVTALARTGARQIWKTTSEDYGQTWAPMVPAGLPNNNSGIDALRLEDGRVLLVFNPVNINWGPRTPLSLAVSGDNGNTWKLLAHLENDCNLDSEYSYPAIIRVNDGIAISYTWNRERVRVWRVPLSCLE